MSLTNTFTELSNNIQSVHIEIFKLILMKRLRPVLSPTRFDVKTQYNTSTGRRERVFIPERNNPDPHIEAYYYRLTKKCLGWKGDIIVQTNIKNRIIKQYSPRRIPYVSKQIKERAQISYNKDAFFNSSTRERILNNNNRNIIDIVLQKSALTVVSDLEATYEYVCFVPYKDIRSELKYIGQDIVDQTSAAIDPALSLRLTTGSLRVSLSQLDEILANMSDDVFNNYVEMNRLLNSLDNGKIPALCRLLATLEVISWANLTDAQRCDFINSLGQCFIDKFNSNQLITDLLNEKQSELILTTSYMFTISKLLFFVFGYDLLANPPPISDCSPPVTNNNNNSNCCDTQESCQPEGCANSEALEYVNIFIGFWPSIASFMDARCPPGCSERQVNCGCVIPSYDGTCTIGQMLWRFYDYSYCVFLEEVKKRLIPNSSTLKINKQIQVLAGL